MERSAIRGPDVQQAAAPDFASLHPGYGVEFQNLENNPMHSRIWTGRQLRVACQVPLQRSPVMMPLHEPAPLLPASRPPPRAWEAPTDT